MRTRWKVGRESEDLRRSRADFRTVLVFVLSLTLSSSCIATLRGVLRSGHFQWINQAAYSVIHRRAGVQFGTEKKINSSTSSLATSLA